MIKEIIMILLLCIQSGFFGFTLGLYIGRKKWQKKPFMPELSDEEKQKIERLQKETRNFWTYDGSGK